MAENCIVVPPAPGGPAFLMWDGVERLTWLPMGLPGQVLTVGLNGQPEWVNAAAICGGGALRAAARRKVGKVLFGAKAGTGKPPPAGKRPPKRK